MTSHMEIAKKLIAVGPTPFLTTDEASEITGVPAVTIRQWLNRGHVVLRTTPRPGKGVPMYFAFNDVVEIMAFAQLSRLHFPPSRFAGRVASVVMSHAMGQISEFAGMWGDPSKRGDDNFNRYVVLFYNQRENNIDWSETHDPMMHIESRDSTRIIIDCRDLALKAIAAFEAHRSKLR